MHMLLFILFIYYGSYAQNLKAIWVCVCVCVCVCVY